MESALNIKAGQAQIVSLTGLGEFQEHGCVRFKAKREGRPVSTPFSPALFKETNQRSKNRRVSGDGNNGRLRPPILCNLPFADCFERVYNILVRKLRLLLAVNLLGMYRYIVQ